MGGSWVCAGRMCSTMLLEIRESNLFDNKMSPDYRRLSAESSLNDIEEDYFGEYGNEESIDEM